MFSLYFWSVVAFFIVLVMIIYRDRKNLDIHKWMGIPVLLMKRTKRGRSFIDRVARMSFRLPLIGVSISWNFFATISVLLAFGVMAYGIYMILLSTYFVTTRVITAPAVQFIIPIPQAQPISGLGFIGIPFWFWILIVPFVMFPHEFAHGIISRANKVKVKTVGVIQFLIWSGAFVEPDEKQIKKSSLTAKLRIFSVGSISNIVTALVVLLFTQYLLWPAFIPKGIVLADVMGGSGAEAAGLRPGMVLQKIDGNEININYGDFSLIYGYLLFRGNVTGDNLKAFSTALEVGSALRGLDPNQTIEVWADGNLYQLKLSGRPENASLPYMGVETKIITKNDGMLEFIFPLIWWLTNISQLVAIFNMLPIYPLDGGLMVEAVSERLSKRHAKKIVKLTTALLISILVFNFIGPLIINIFV